MADTSRGSLQAEKTPSDAKAEVGSTASPQDTAEKSPLSQDESEATGTGAETTEGATEGEATVVAEMPKLRKDDDSDSDNDLASQTWRLKRERTRTLRRLRGNMALEDYDTDLWATLDNVLAQAESTQFLVKKLATATSSRLTKPKKERKEGYNRQMVTPKLENMSWKQWCATRGRTGVSANSKRGTLHGTTETKSDVFVSAADDPDPRTIPAAIDVLVEEPQIEQSRGRKLQHSRSSPSTSDETAECSPASERLQAPSPLPARIRINSTAAKCILDSLFNDELKFWLSEPLIIERPFKILVLMEKPIRDRFAELKGIRSKRRDAMREQSDTRSEEELHSRKFPDNTMFRTGTNWESLTVDELQEAVDEFGCIVNFMDIYLEPLRARLRQQPAEVQFNELWHFFNIDEFVYVKDTPQKIWKVLQTTGGRKYLSEPEDQEVKNWHDKHSPFVVDCYYLDFDGNNFIPVCSRFKIWKSEDRTSVASLPVMPLGAAKKAGLIDVQAARDRGHKFLGYRTPQHRFYKGLTLSRSPKGEDLVKPVGDGIAAQRVFSERIESQVIVDFERALQANPDWVPVDQQDLTVYKADPAELKAEDYLEMIDLDMVWDLRWAEELIESEGNKWQSWSRGLEEPTGDDLLLFPDRVFAFVLRSRTWACLKIGADGAKEGIREVSRRPEPWEASRW